ncbi:glutathione S-transferase family protein [Paracoccus sp. (in: a-proteobacteria)]|uniref:glutathione S-transferase family protein n=1 Tax=Paracoccus sp. TaxID=267 RepID=UPI00289B721C|nr:glutathione S-transferase family protein [Paracoccus sp. (in: a-proteobacteria)]
MLTIHGVTRSRASRLIWLCHEIGVDFHQIPVIQAYRLADPDAADAPPNTHSPDFLQLSSAGTIPVLVDGDLVISDSFAGAMYLARKYGLPLGPTDLAEEGQMLQWCFYAATSIEAEALTLLFLHRPGAVQLGEDQAIVANAAERLIRPMRVLEEHFSQNEWLVSGRFTVADLIMAEVLRYAQGYAPLFEQFPATAAWLAKCQARPAFQKMWHARLNEPE